ncbi:horcolin isoform X2 [Brachypodium distachyon]|uniref:horcolin isoform X2 n=1 Tax=Brachypodium distachyon TaxID=15368 RepID=UPI0001C73C00|nr:horcolin isoform X2 [Brachypodium distachyon]|eukprot:XP_003573652.1 horcolin isoform X2 [Brachypodium distachyon]
MSKPAKIGPWGGPGGDEQNVQITLDPTDYVTGISGTFGTAFDNDRVVTSLKISTFKEKDGSKTYGKPNGTPFHIPVRDGGRVVGFFGRSGDMLDAIGVYFAP